MPTLPIALALTTAAAFASLFGGCAASVKDEGKWGDLAEGGDVKKLHDAGTFCAPWTPSDYSPSPNCATDDVCSQWAENAYPPSFLIPDPAQCLANAPGHGGHCDLAGPNTPDCNPGQAGDAYCQAYYEAWMQPGVDVNAKCYADNACGVGRDQMCSYCVIDCGSTGPNTVPADGRACPGPDWLSMCVVEHDGSIGCQELCADAPSGVPQRQ